MLRALPVPFHCSQQQTVKAVSGAQAMIQGTTCESYSGWSQDVKQKQRRQEPCHSSKGSDTSPVLKQSDENI
ncbi:rCG22328 [Rattus norvegicus]|uniref:RCG22328 n=1 Tax=Rattus norvegicus TaxID=10116 RepID=A6INP9_RAT|nr:rCG22328 [Rattus norvegicus]